jgi:hypothetical protein
MNRLAHTRMRQVAAELAASTSALVVMVEPAGALSTACVGAGSTMALGPPWRTVDGAVAVWVQALAGIA